jgi:hypothetical protein
MTNLHHKLKPRYTSPRDSTGAHGTHGYVHKDSMGAHEFDGCPWNPWAPSGHRQLDYSKHTRRRPPSWQNMTSQRRAIYGCPSISWFPMDSSGAHEIQSTHGVHGYPWSMAGLITIAVATGKYRPPAVHGYICAGCTLEWSQSWMRLHDQADVTPSRQSTYW